MSFKGHLGKNERPLETGSLANRTVVQDRHMCPLEKGARAFGTNPTMVPREHDGPSSGYHSVNQ